MTWLCRIGRHDWQPSAIPVAGKAVPISYCPNCHAMRRTTEGTN